MRFLLPALLIAFSACGLPAGESTNVTSNANISSTAKAVSANAVPAGRKVVVISPDGVQIVGTFFESPQPNSPALLLLHQWQSDRHSYDDFAVRMQLKSFNVLSIDGRGFGESTKTADGKIVAPKRTDDAVKAMLGDVDAAVQFLGNQPNVDKSKIGIVGASYGSSLALIYSEEHSNIAAAALLSPGLNYFGNMPTVPAASRYGFGRPLLLIAAKDDPDSAEAVDRLLDGLPQDSRWGMAIYDKGGHGTALLKAGAVDDIEKFFAESLGGGR